MAYTVTWTGSSGQKYHFEVHPDGQPFWNVSGVYIFCKQLVSGSWEALYVGETQSLNQRLNLGIGNHDGYTRSKNYGMTHVGVMQVYGEAERLRIETDLRHALNPAANLQNVSGGYR